VIHTFRPIILLVILGGSLAAMLTLEPIAQNVVYHDFADNKSLLGIQNFADVVSNLTFMLVGLWGISHAGQWVGSDARAAWWTMFAGVALVSFGSAYYHLSPNNETLVWDRLPMTMGFMGLFVALLAENIDIRFGIWGLVPALLTGAATVVYWDITNDLRPYYWIQLAPLLTIPAVLLLFPSRYTGNQYLILALGCYLLAKLAEMSDADVLMFTQGTISGHTLKHLFAALGPLCLYMMLVNRRRLEGGK